MEEPTDTSIQATVSSNNGSVIAVLGITVLTDAATEYDNALGESISAAEFLIAAATGTLVQVFGSVTGGEIDAYSLELE